MSYWVYLKHSRTHLIFFLMWLYVISATVYLRSTFCSNSFLQEVGYTDSVLAIRQSRVRQLLCATNGDVGESESVNSLRKRFVFHCIYIVSAFGLVINLLNVCSPSNRNSLTLPENEEAVLRTFDFLESATKSAEKPNPPVDAEAPWNDDKPASGVSNPFSVID